MIETKLTTDSILLSIKENDTIKNKVSAINVSGITIKLKDKINYYLIDKAYKIIKYHNPTLELNTRTIKFIEDDHFPGFYFMIAYTKTHSNHPYLIYVNMYEKYINVLIPIGKEKQQVNINEYNDIIKAISIQSITKHNPIIYYKIHSHTMLLFSISLLLDETLKTRKEGILTSQFSILKCENMTLCINKVNEISKMTLSQNEKQKLYIKVQDYYMKQGIELLKKYFKLLYEKNYSEAYSFLKGGDSKFDKYYGKTRLNTFFKNNKIIIGHLEIFISLYEFLHIVKMKLFNL